jgi:hypothetical protein
MFDDSTAQRLEPTAHVYVGGCSCGSVQYEVVLAPAFDGQHTSSVWELAVPCGAFKLLRGEQLTGHQFASDTDAASLARDPGCVDHFYCERCGVLSFSRHERGADRGFYLIDLKCLQHRVTAPSGRRDGSLSR